MCPRPSSFKRVCWGLLLSSWSSHLSKFAEVASLSLCIKRSSFKILLNFRKACIFQEFAEDLLLICVCWIFESVQHPWKIWATSGACIKPDCLARRPLCHKLNQPSCVAWRRLHHKVNLPRCEAWQRHLIMTWYFRHRTNEHFSSMLFIRKNL